MIPNYNNYDIKIKEQLTTTYSLENPSLMIDDIEAIKQAAYLMLCTEKYEYAIYSWNYGIELLDLIGKNKGYVYSELERRIAETLTQDDRIKSVDSFSFSSSGNKVLVQFTVNTILGDFDSEVTINV